MIIRQRRIRIRIITTTTTIILTVIIIIIIIIIIIVVIIKKWTPTAKKLFAHLSWRSFDLVSTSKFNSYY